MKVTPADAFKCHTKTCTRTALVRMEWPGAGPVNYCMLCAELGAGILSKLQWPTPPIESLPAHEGTEAAMKAQAHELIERVTGALAAARAAGVEPWERCDCQACAGRRPV